MGTISYVVPVAGTDLNSIADPEIATALTTIKTAINGNIDTNNLSPTAGITFAQLAAGAGRMSLVTKTATYAANSGDLVLAGVTGAPFTVTLPAPSLNALVGIVAGASAAGASPITVARQGAAVINGAGLSSATSFVLGAPGAFAVLQSDGTNWFIITGQRDTGWVGLSGVGGVSQAAGYYNVAYRIRSDHVELRGAAQNTSGADIISGATIITNAPAPASKVAMMGLNPGGGVQAISIGASSSNLVSINGLALAQTIVLDGLNYLLA